MPAIPGTAVDADTCFPPLRDSPLECHYKAHPRLDEPSSCDLDDFCLRALVFPTHPAPGLLDRHARGCTEHAPLIGSGVLLDLGGATFLDCAGLNVLLATRRGARLEGGWMRVVRPSAAAWRVIPLLGVQDVLTAEG